MTYARRNTGQSLHRLEVHNTSRTSTRECTDWLAEKLSRYSAKDIADLAGISLAAAENLKQGRNGASMKTITELCRNDPQFRADYFYHCGGYVESDPEFITGITMAMNSLIRRQNNA